MYFTIIVDKKKISKYPQFKSVIFYVCVIFICQLTPILTTVFMFKGLAADIDLYGGIAGYDLIVIYIISYTNNILVTEHKLKYKPV